jgi:hypothetical protein
MHTRVGKFLRNALGNVIYWIGWALAILVIAQAIFISITSGSLLAPILLGGVGLIVWLVTSTLRRLLAGR